MIFSARKNIRNYMDSIENEKNKYPISFQLNYGSLMTQSAFPKNVYFMQVINKTFKKIIKNQCVYLY